ncbi:MAG: hypothetical protein KDB01_27725, partial [Planctomycetaceae bacterium]|nr:hypothetical protein [Planctomycetaceae bacterium]
DAALSVSDDLLQTDCAYGGLSDEGAQFYMIRYFHGAGVGVKWDLDCCAKDVFAIADGEVTSLELWKCDSDRCPNRFTSPDGGCDYCAYWNWVTFQRPTSHDEESCQSPTDWLLLFARTNPGATTQDAYWAFHATPELKCWLGPPPFDWMRNERSLG